MRIPIWELSTTRRKVSSLNLVVNSLFVFISEIFCILLSFEIFLSKKFPNILIDDLI